MNPTTKREESAQIWREMEVQCRNCGTSKMVTRGQIRRGDDVMPMSPCHDDEHVGMLCENCPQGTCFECDLLFCDEHLIRTHGTTYCRKCFNEMKAEDAIADREEFETGADRTPPRE